MRYRVINSDGHTVEPPYIWEKYLPARYVDRAPRLVKDSKGGDAWEFERGAPPMPLRHNPGKGYEALGYEGVSYASVNKGIYDGAARLQEMKFDGVDAEILYPSQRTMNYFMQNEDDEFHKAGIDAYNRWVFHEYAAHDHQRLLPMFQLPNLGIEVSLAELRRAREEGFRGVLISALPSGNADISETDDPFWAEAERLGMPIHIHLDIKRTDRRKASAKAAATAAAKSGRSPLGGAAVPQGQFGETMAEFVFSGMFDRYPKLQVVGAEVQAGWIPSMLEYWDDRYWRNRTRHPFNLELLPSEYFFRNWRVTFIIDYFGVQNRHAVGVKNMMWSTDYPHQATDWPYSRKVIDQMFFGVPAEEKYAMICGNALELCGLKSD